MLGPARIRNITITAAAVSITAAMIQTVLMRSPPSLPRRLPVGVALERRDQQSLDLRDLMVEPATALSLPTSMTCT